MALDLEVINKLRAEQGLDPLTELPKKDATPTLPSKSDVLDKNPDPETPPTQVLNQDSVLEFLRQQGIEASSLEDLKKKPEVDPLLAAEQRDAAILSYGLQKGKFNKKTYESFIKESSDLEQLVFQQEFSEAQKEDSELTLEDFQAEFATKYGLDTELGTRKHKQGQKNLTIIGNQILQNKYKNIYETESDYSNYENSQKSIEERNKKIEAGAKKYKEKIDTVFNKLKKIPAKFSDEEVYEVDAMNDSLDALKALMTQDDFATQQILRDTPEEELSEIAYTRFLRDNFPRIAKEIAVQYAHKNQKGTRGIPVPAKINEGEGAILSPEQKKFVDIYKANNTPVGAN